MQTEDQAEIISEAILLPERERLSRRVSNRAKRNKRDTVRQRAHRLGALVGGIVGCGLYFGIERSLLLVLASSVVGSWIFDIASSFRLGQRNARTPDHTSSPQ